MKYSALVLTVLLVGSCSAAAASVCRWRTAGWRHGVDREHRSSVWRMDGVQDWSSGSTLQPPLTGCYHLCTANSCCKPSLLTNRRLSVLWHCWLGHLIRKIMREVTYNVSSGTVNPTITYRIIW